MTIRHLQIFLAVCSRQSITAAAEELNMTQPAVSIAIRELENYYGTRLFDRMNRRIYLTESGQTLRSYAGAVLEQFNEAAEVLRGGAGQTRLTLGVNVSIGETCLPELLQRLEKRIPNLKTEVTVDDARAIDRRLASNELDFALADGLPERPGRLCSPFYTERMALVGAKPEKGLTLRRLAEARLLLREEGSGSRACVQTVLAAQGLAVRPAVESASDLCLVQLAAAGAGYAVLPRALAERAAAAGTLFIIPLEDAVFERRYSLVYNRKKYLSPAAHSALAVLREWAAEQAVRPADSRLPRQTSGTN